MISSVFLDQFIRRLGLALSPHLFLLLLKKASFMHKNTKTFLKISIFYLFVWVLFVSIWISPILYIIYPVFLLSLLLRRPPQPSQFSTSALTKTLYNLCLTDFSTSSIQTRKKCTNLIFFVQPRNPPLWFLVIFTSHLFLKEKPPVTYYNFCFLLQFFFNTMKSFWI